MKVLIHFDKSIILILVLFTLISCKEDFKVYPIALDFIDSNKLEYIDEVDFRYLEKGNTIFNTVVFTLKPLDSIVRGNQKINLEEQLDIDIQLAYKNKEYKTFQKFLSIHNMYEGQIFTVECTTELMDEKSELFLFLQNFDAYNTKERIEKLKKELPQMKLVVRIEDEMVELEVTNKTKAIYTKVPNHMRNIISMSYD
ncbi:hypothetical protein [Myroides sp. WP-1]|uniref:hypothetical protein n=1 Tax=Myroides sp. WP-1 TaxID=2759944 RepID=UPI0015FB3DAE|nr:hypothetical protein [Myroides sp. WP-1]MBB1139286.1 hypothetical protein [Myroides sp. WP-1]